MEKKIIDFIIRHFGCPHKGDEKVITSLGNMGCATPEEILNAFPDEAEKYISIRESEVKGYRTIILKENVRKEIEENFINKKI